MMERLSLWSIERDECQTQPSAARALAAAGLARDGFEAARRADEQRIVVPRHHDLRRRVHGNLEPISAVRPMF